MADHAGSDEVDTVGVDEAGWKKVEIIGDAVRDDGMSSIVSSLCSGAKLDCWTEDIDKLSLALENSKVS